ncbi:hypothetical protein OSTOST_20915, partial [Ostertagia ostertagi]
ATLSKDEEEAQLLRGLPLAPPPSLVEGSSRNSPKHVTISDQLNKNHSELPSPDFELKQVSPRSSFQSGMTSYFTAQESLSGNGSDLEDEDLDATLRDIGEENYEMQDVVRPTSFDRTSPRMSSFRQGDPTVPKESPLFAPLTSPRSARPTAIPVPPPRISS